MNKFSIIQRLRNKIRIKDNSNISIGINTKIVKSKFYIKGNNNSLTIGDNVIIRNSNIEIVGNNCSIHIDNNCMIGDNCYLSAKEQNTKITIGKDCGFSRNVNVMTSDGHPVFKNKLRINEAKSIHFGTHIWIAENVTILKGVNIGDGSVIGINSTVTKDIQSNSIVVGNPAKIIKEDIEWES
jgi:acetyltransferase-like isoleucine patch superfamily enzyme